jgi:hypothetical protein
MKRLFVIVTICTVLSIGASLVLVVEDRRLGVSLPYSLGAAVGLVQIAAGFLAIAWTRWPRRAATSRFQLMRSLATESLTQNRAREGVVLLDVASPEFAARNRAA